MEILHGHSDKLTAMSEAALVGLLGNRGFGECQSIGVVTGLTAEDKLHAIATYHDFHPEHKTCMVSFVSFYPKWAVKGIIRAILSIPFEQYDVKKLSAWTSIDNKRCMKLLEGVGFTKEAVLAHQFGAKNHAVVYRMMFEDYKRKYGLTNG